ncbi:MAG: CHAT domain-containing protein [Bacteroidales bacterium]|nr:CHAT domain-containing protein [Bacteroidales bacterium]
MKKYLIIAFSILATASLLSSIPLYSQNKSLSSKADSLSKHGMQQYEEGHFEEAIPLIKESINLYEATSGRVSENIAFLLNELGNCYAYLGESSTALQQYLSALPLWVDIYGREHEEYAGCLFNIGTCYHDMGDYSQALEYYGQSLSICERVLGKDSSDYADCLNNIGNLYFDLGEYSKALDYHLLSLSIYERVYGNEHPDYAGSLMNLANCYTSLGDYSKGLDYYQKSLGIWEIVMGPENPEYARVLTNIGNCFFSVGDFITALGYYQKAVDIGALALGKKHPEYASFLNNLGGCYAVLGQNSLALECSKKSLSIRAEVLGIDHPEYIQSLNTVGNCYRYLGDYELAQEYLKQSLDARAKLYGEYHPEYAIDLMDRGICYISMGDYDNASEFLRKYTYNVSSIVTRVFSSLSETSRALFWDKYKDFFTNSLYDYTVIIDSPEMSRSAYDGSLLGKGLLLNAETEMRKLILESGDEDALRMFNEVQDNKVMLDRLYEDPVGKKKAIDSLYNDIEKRQQELMKRSKVFGDYTRNLALMWTDVQSSLGKKDIAIEFQTYSHQDTTFYIALTLRPGYAEPHLVELFNSEDLKGVRARYYKDTGMRDYYSSPSLTKLIWGRLSDELTGIRNVYFSPAGELNIIGIEYLLDEDGDHLVSEKRNYYRLTSTRELVKERKSTKMASATVYGGIRYDITPETHLTGEESESERLASAATRSWLPKGELSRARWDYLPGTKEEADAISSTLFSRRVHNDLIEGETSTEESFKSLSGAKNDVIHIATHGFYWTEKEANSGDTETSFYVLDGQHNAPKEDKALTRSGLLFAGAQNAFEGKDIPIDVEDGILTAKDISRMDLRGTELAVLSACQSGLGEVTGDGVFGLQRGFKKAGVQSLVMSLWKVSDEATKIMMTRFYENLAKGKSKYDAFREAQNYLRKYDGGLYDEPEYYAAFVLLDAIK